MSTRHDNEERAKRIEQYYIRHNKDKKRTYAHFIDEGLSKKTIYHILRRHDQRGDVTFKKPSGRRVSVCTPEMFDKLANVFKYNPDLSCREAAKQLGVARTTIFRIMAKMREKNLDTHKVIVPAEPRCPTCHQKIEKKPDQPVKAPVKQRRKKANETLTESDTNNTDEQSESNNNNNHHHQEEQLNTGTTTTTTTTTSNNNIISDNSVANDTSSVTIDNSSITSTDDVVEKKTTPRKKTPEASTLASMLRK